MPASAIARDSTMWPSRMPRAASAIASLHHLAANGMLDASTAPSDEHLRALAHQQDLELLAEAEVAQGGGHLPQHLDDALRCSTRVVVAGFLHLPPSGGTTTWANVRESCRNGSVGTYLSSVIATPSPEPAPRHLPLRPIGYAGKASPLWESGHSNHDETM